ncbi:ArgS-related anticodon-binding protein NrtL [Streptomyces sp. NBC_00401]|uniref:ArgS-related anticodon-binding protein NrtL n=1 Tax=Streptomyces sp. NBC_00401 TaxID=2975738 RepID=UPI002254A247|nr:DALR anticodon-binding domain-containing protein [Streptomyces sp. NBC_00401]MCX5086891.1 DALR anticodon-binding domain-containing protein [Streptomyces sp. NBC_00401]
MTPVELSRTVLRAVRRAVDDGELSVAVPARVVVERPRPGGCGDYSTNVALQLAGPAGRPPRHVAELLSRRLSDSPGIVGVEVTGPGFLNLTLADDDPGALAREILARGGGYGASDVLAGQRIEIRIPYEVRAEAVADSLRRILATQGAQAHVVHGETAESSAAHVVNLRPVPAPCDPAVLGRDASRWALLLPAAHDRPRIDDEHLAQREGNPLFRVRYAHARTKALPRNAAALGFTAEPGDVRDQASAAGDAPSTAGALRATGAPSTTGAPSATPALADAPSAPDAPSTPGDVRDHDTATDSGVAVRARANAAAALHTALSAYPQALTLAATHHAPDRLARQLVVVADALLGFQHTVLPQGEEKPSAAHRARLALAEAAGAVLAGGLSLLGIDAPEHL